MICLPYHLPSVLNIHPETPRELSPLSAATISEVSTTNSHTIHLVATLHYFSRAYGI